MKAFAKMTAVAVVAFATSVSTAAAQALPAASDIVAKHVAAIGGKDALSKITSMTQKGTMEVPTAGLTATMEASSAQNRLLIKQTIPGIGEILQGYDGTVAWSTNPMQGPRLLKDKEFEQMKEQADFEGSMVFAADRYSKMETVGQVDFNGEKAYKVRFVRKPSGNESIGYFSVASGLQIGSETTQVAEGGKLELTTEIGDYKQFGPVKMSTKQSTTMGPNKIIMTVQDVIVNSVSATAFAPPADVKALIKP
ncbi:MAG TPA: hypothetical protein VE869_14130 [Gemmatimonas sp.]|nr:hypothetical protein [Gemmatimonas sp.]